MSVRLLILGLALSLSAPTVRAAMIDEVSSGGQGEIEFEKKAGSAAKDAAVELDAKDVEALQNEVETLDNKIKVTKQEIGRVRDASYLPDLYFALADMHTQKARAQYLLKLAANPGKPDLDFTAEKRPKLEAIDIYQKIYSFFPKEKRRDKALFLTGLEQRDLGQFEAMIKTFNKLSEEFPSSEHFNEANIIAADYLLERKKSIEGAIDLLRKVVSRPISPFTPLAHYRMGWCLINLSRYEEALRAFEEAITTQGMTNASELPELYRRTDIKREAVLSLSIPFVEMYTDPKRTKPLPAPVDYFRQKAPDHFTFRRALSRVGRRLILKEKWKEAADAFYHVLVMSNDYETRFEALQRVNDAHKRNESKVDSLPFVREIAITVDLLQASLERPIVFDAAALVELDKAKVAAGGGAKKAGGGKAAPKANLRRKNGGALIPTTPMSQLVFLELLMRDFATQLHKKARASGSPEDFDQTAEAYEAYLFRFPVAPKALDIKYNLAEAQFKAGKLVHAGMEYELLSKDARLKPRTSYFKELAVESFAKALQAADQLTAVDRIRARRGLRTVGQDWLQANPRAPGAPTVAFNIANSWYEERSLKKAIEGFRSFVKQYPKDARVRDAIFLTINSFSQLDDYKGLQTSGEQLIRTSSLSEPDKATVREAIKRAQSKQLQSLAGEYGAFGSKEYAENLLSVASKYKGSSLGVQALYEAFNSLRSKKDPDMFDVGEALLDQHADSQYAKEVTSSMATLALATASFHRAAKYLAIFADKYPKEKESTEFRKTAALLFERKGDYKKAREQYEKLGDRLSVARMDLKTNDWSALERSSAALNTVQGKYWRVLSIWRQNRYQDAAPLLKALASDSKAPAEQTGHAQFLLVQLPLERYRSIQMKSAEDQAALVQKIKAFQVLSKELEAIVKSAGGKWPIAALYLLGQTHYDLGRFIADSPLPAGLSPADKKTYIGELNKQAGTYLAEAAKVFSKCIDAAQANDVFTRYVDGCRANGSKPVREDEDMAATAPKAGGTEPPKAREIRMKLIDQPKNAELLFSLGEAYIAADQPQTAAGIFSRILEFDPKNANALAGIGISALYANDFDLAYDQFKSALALDQKNSIALYNLAGLYKQFGFTTKFNYVRSKTNGLAKARLVHPFAKAL